MSGLWIPIVHGNVVRQGLCEWAFSYQVRFWLLAFQRIQLKNPSCYEVFRIVLFLPFAPIHCLKEISWNNVGLLACFYSFQIIQLKHFDHKKYSTPGTYLTDLSLTQKNLNSFVIRWDQSTEYSTEVQNLSVLHYLDPLLIQMYTC
jgi:hypothetical protein